MLRPRKSGSKTPLWKGQVAMHVASLSQKFIRMCHTQAACRKARPLQCSKTQDSTSETQDVPIPESILINPERVIPCSHQMSQIIYTACGKRSTFASELSLPKRAIVDGDIGIQSFTAFNFCMRRKPRPCKSRTAFWLPRAGIFLSGYSGLMKQSTLVIIPGKRHIIGAAFHGKWQETNEEREFGIVARNDFSSPPQPPIRC